MKSSWMKIATLVFVVAVVLGMSLPKSQASMSLANGKFTLPFAGKLGGMSLPAGDYTYTVEGGKTEFGIITIYQNQKIMGMMLAQSFESHEDKSQYPVLVFVRHDGNSVLRAFRLPGTGTFYFTLPKEMKTLIAQQPQLIETIQVQASGN
jgi:hypothetical protein